VDKSCAISTVSWNNKTGQDLFFVRTDNLFTDVLARVGKNLYHRITCSALETDVYGSSAPLLEKCVAGTCADVGHT
jgi:hypothetical protein